MNVAQGLVRSGYSYFVRTSRGSGKFVGRAQATSIQMNINITVTDKTGKIQARNEVRYLSPVAFGEIGFAKAAGRLPPKYLVFTVLPYVTERRALFAERIILFWPPEKIQGRYLLSKGEHCRCLGVNYLPRYLTLP